VRFVAKSPVLRHLALVVIGLVAVLVVAGQLARADAGPSPIDPEDSLPAWASDGVHVAFERQVPGANWVFSMTSAGKDTSLAGASGVLRGYIPGTTHMLVQSVGTTLVITGSRFEGPLATLAGTDATASPDGSRVAYVRNGILYVARIDASGERPVSTNVEPPSDDLLGPVWSPDGTRIAIASGATLLIVKADGGGVTTVFPPSSENVNPTWSPDSSTIAFESNTPHWSIWVVQANGSGAHQLIGGESNNRFPQFSPVSSTLAFVSDRQRLRGGATQYQYALYTQPLSSSIATKLVDDVHPYSPPRWSPTAALIAVAAGQECQRWGVYIVESVVGSRAHRHSNRCRFDGTASADSIHGTEYFDIINGNGGDDVIHGLGGNDKISGEGGNDAMYGDIGNDFILGGPGNDRIYGGSGNDVIVPGNGRDHVDCGLGNDTVEGAGPLDVIARNCEHVKR
jgi:dipeptidyl aminopeptidase/acylaminoacyl peptidase